MSTFQKQSAGASSPVVCGHALAQGTHRRVEFDTAQYDALQAVYDRHGGLLSGDDVVWRLRRVSAQPISRLARWIVSRSILSMSWQARTLVPAFQFDLADMSVRSPCVAALRELDGFVDESGAVVWFATPNGWLDDRAPVDAFADNPAAVVQAARADRFALRG